ncbi:MAG: hypothetical protein IPI64_12685 [Chloracidobacterium sp.]|nr:hypothetical protein [Chloracidobacterium sp.]
MRRIVISIFAVMVLGIAVSTASAQIAKRITFKRGATSATVTGTLSSYKSKRVFVIRVLEGQTMKTENTGNGSISIFIEGPAGSGYEQDMAADCHSNNEVTPTVAGDYKLTIQECTKADAWKGTFRFKVTVD